MIETPAGTTIEAKNQSGSWLSVGPVGENSEFYNPAIPSSYLSDAEHVTLRIAGDSGTEVQAPLYPVIMTLSSSRNDDGNIKVEGTTSLATGNAESFSEGVWKSIGPVQNGMFSNPSVPSHYLLNENTIRIRVKSNFSTSDAVDSTLEFPHSRSLLIRSTTPAAEDAALRDWGIQHADYQPTGYFASANTDIEVWVSGNIDDVTLLVGTPELVDANDTTRNEVSAREFRLTRGRNIFRDTYGGVLHIRNLTGEHTSATRLIFGEATLPIPFYVQESTNHEQWIKMLNTGSVKQVEMFNGRTVIAVLRNTALLYTDIDPAEVLDSHEFVLKTEAQRSGLDGSSLIHSRSSLLLYAVQNASTSPHASHGYIAIPYQPVRDVYNDSLIGGRTANQWVTLHEYGHHFQNHTNNYGVFVEISVNNYALAVNLLTPNEYTDQFPERWPATQEWLALPRSEKDISTSPDAQAYYEQLRKGLGENYLPAWDKYIRENPTSTPDLSSFILSATISAGYDLADFFADWGILKEDETEIWDAVRALNLPKPPVNLIEIRPYV